MSKSFEEWCATINDFTERNVRELYNHLTEKHAKEMDEVYNRKLYSRRKLESDNKSLQSQLEVLTKCDKYGECETIDKSFILCQGCKNKQAIENMEKEG